MRKECIVSLESQRLEACSLLRPWVLEEDTLMNLEYTWGLRYRTLKPNFEANTIYLTPELRRMFDSDLWALLPVDVPLLTAISNTNFTLENPIETAYEGMDIFDYVFVPLPGMDGTITRLVEQGSLLDVAPQEHFFPYDTLPVLHLAVQPHYVIFDFCRKVRKHQILVMDIRDEKACGPYFLKYKYPVVRSRCLYKRWTTRVVPASFKDDTGEDTEGTSEVSTTLRKRYPDTFADEVGLRPADSVTCVSDCEDEEENSDDDGDEVAVDETDSAFEARMTRWVAELQPGQMLLDFQPSLFKTYSSDATENGSDADTGSPTMVGSVSSAVDANQDYKQEKPKYEMDAPYQTKSASDMSLGQFTLVNV